MIDNAKSLAKKLKQMSEWLASMHKQITNARWWKVQVIEEVKVEIINMKESLHAKLQNWRRMLASKFISYEMNFSPWEMKTFGFGVNFGGLIAKFMAQDLQTKRRKGSTRWSMLVTRLWPKPNSFIKHTKRRRGGMLLKGHEPTIFGPRKHER